MDKKKLQEYINNLQKIADDKYLERKSITKSVEGTNENKGSNIVLPQSIQPLAEGYNNYLKTTLSSGTVINYGESFALSSDKFFTVEVDYVGLIASSGNLLKDISKCELCVWGKSRLAHCEYDIYALKTGKLLGSYSATHNLYYVDLKRLYDLYGDASFKFVARWSGTESLSLDKISIQGKYLTSIKITNPPDKISYVIGGTFDKTGLVINACYSNGDMAEVSNFSVSPATNLLRKDKFVTISYKGFSVKQPIQVNSQKIVPGIRLQARKRTTYNSPWSEWEDVPPASPLEYYVGCGEFRETRTLLSFDRSKISLEEGEKTGLRLQLVCSHYPKPTEPAKHIKINGIRVKKDPKYNFINAYIGDLKAEDSENLEVVLEYDDYTFAFDYNSPVFLFYCDECDPTTLVENKQIDVAEGSLNLNLCTGEVRYELTDFDKANNTLGCGISHLLSSNNELEFYGRNFSLNLCEHLSLDTVNANKIVKSHLYTDAYGVKHTFTVLLYYVDNGKRVYIDKLDYGYVSSDLRFLGHSVFVEQVTINNQIYLETPSSAVLNNSYYKNILNSEANELALPVRWLKRGDLTKGFNEQGNLVLIIDEFNNYIAINYNTNGSISKVSNNSGDYVNFTYNEHEQLESLINNRNKKVKYAYNLYGRLETIEYCDLEGDNATERVYKTVKLSYEILKKDFYNCVGISQIDTSDKYRTLISYDSTLFNSKVSKIHNYSVTTGCDENEVVTELSSLNIEFDYYNDQTTLTDEFGDKEIYKYENGKALTSYYSIKNGKVSDAKKIDYTSYSIYTETKAKSSTLNKSSLGSFVFEEGEKIEAYLNPFNMPSWSELSGVYLNNNAYKNVTTHYEYDDNLNCIETKIEESFFDSNTGEMTNSNLIKINKIYNAVTGKLIKQITHRAHDGGDVREKADIVEYVYDWYGNREKEVKYSVDWEDHSTLEDCNCSAMTTTDKFYSECSYDLDHNVSSVKDETGLNIEEYEYYSGSKSLSNLISGDRTTYFVYDSRDRLSNIYATVDSESNGNTIAYNMDAISKLEPSGGTKITFDYDAKRRISCVKLDESVLENYNYEDKVQGEFDIIDRITKTDANNTSIKVEADRAGKFIKKYCDNELQLTQNYNSNGTLDSIVDSMSNRNIDITYDDYGNIIKFEEGTGSDLLCESFEYNVRGLIDKINYTGIVERTESLTYNKDSNVALTELSYGNLKIKPSFDINGRLTTTSIVVGLNEISNETITYRKEGDHATHIPLRKIYKNVVAQTLTNTPKNPFIPNPKVPINENTTYSYDEFGNIETIMQDGVLIAKYSYDKLNRLVREDNAQFNYSYELEYDNNGNIKYKIYYKLNSYTEKHSTIESVEYGYDKDRLTSYNSDVIIYDNIGNPTYYRNKIAVWSKGKQLTEFDGNSFEYDGQGRRIKKNNITFYYDSNNRLIKQSNGLEFYYNGNDVVAVSYKNKYYYYRKDMQGNVIAILDSTGKKVVVYSYDAWGYHWRNFLSDNSSEVTELISLNPFRYRSYYYDTETGLYYLNSRYYDPIVGRWLNSDNPLIAAIGKNYLNGLNLYAYCFNNPVMYIDVGGLFPKKIDFHIHEKGQFSEHIHVDLDGKKYTWYLIGHKKHHGDELGFEDVSKTMKKRLKERGVPDDYFNESVIVKIQKWQERFSYVDMPVFRERFNIVDYMRSHERMEKTELPFDSEGFDQIEEPPYQEGFSVLDGAIIGGAVVAATLIILAFFTGGQSLWGFALFA